jgi:hypothetical protein
VLTDDDLRDWERDPVGTAERVFPGARAAVERFDLDITTPPTRPSRHGWSEIGYSPTRHFGTWAAEVARLSDPEVHARRSDY